MATKELTAADVEKLRSRLQQVELARARLEERRATALAARREAEEQLEKLGFDPEDAADELIDLYTEVDAQLTELESLLDI